ncbi:SPASM domain-containing protein, partial [Chloroflexota bacterium]
AIFFTNWTEPFLSKTLNNYVSVVREQNLFCIVSSNLSLKPKNNSNTIQQALAAGADRLFVSVSGYNQSIYEINHVGGNISWVKENLEQIALLKRQNVIRTEVVLKFIKFDYNVGEEHALREYAKYLGLDFEMVEGSSHPNHADTFTKDRLESYYFDRLKDYIPSRTNENNGEICDLIMRDIPIDCQGDVYLCCATPNYPTFKVGSFLEMSYEEILLKRYLHPYCPSCQIPRRKATVSDCDMLVSGLKSRLGQ